MESMALGAVPAALNFTLKSAQAGFELQQVPKETRELFRTISSTRNEILLAKEKRKSLAKVCSAQDIAEWDQSLRELESALSSLEQLVEGARVDMQHNKGKVKLSTKALWVLRDSKSLPATNDRLNLAYTRMTSCYSRLQFLASLSMSESSRRRETKHEDEIEPLPPAYSEHTSKAIAARRREDKERMERSGSVNTLPDYIPSSGSNTPGRSGFTSPHSPAFEYTRDQQTPTFPVRDGLQDVFPSASKHPGRLATTSAVHLPSNAAHQRERDPGWSPNNNPAHQPGLHPRSSSMPYLHPNLTSNDRAAYQRTLNRADYSPTLLSPQMSQLNISSPRDRVDPEAMSTFSYDHRREGSVQSNPFESSATTLRGTPDPYSTYAPLSRHQSPPQPPPTTQYNPNPPTNPNFTTSQNQTQRQPYQPPYPVTRNTTVQSRYRGIPEVEENDDDDDDDDDDYHRPPRQHNNNNRIRDPSLPRSLNHTQNKYTESLYSADANMYDKPLPPGPQYTYHQPPSQPPAPSQPSPPPQAPTTSVSKTSQLFAGQRTAKEIKYKPYISETEVLSESPAQMPGQGGYQPYRPGQQQGLDRSRDSYMGVMSEAGNSLVGRFTTDTNRSCF